MISFVKGTVDSVSENSVIVDNGGIGYEINITQILASNLRVGAALKLYTYFQVKEANVALFGFEAKEQLEMFQMLISVSSVGPKSALSILSQTTVKDLKFAIVSEDIKLLSKFQGIGKTTAARIILDLKNKISTDDTIFLEGDVSSGGPAGYASGSTQENDAIDALMALEFSRSEAVKAVVKVSGEGMSANDIVKLALKAMKTSNN